MNAKFKIPILIIGIVALFIFQAKGVMPIVYDIVSSDFFLEESPDQANQMAISNDMTYFAFNHCNTYISDDINSDFSISFPEKATHAWTMGNYQYIVNAEIIITPTNSAGFTKTYACRITYDETDDLSVANDFDNWSISGISGLADL